jgi:signal transduction histidine kinase
MNVRGRDLGSFVSDAQAAIARQLPQARGLSVSWGGEFESKERAMRRLLVVLPLALVVTLTLLFNAFGKLSLALLDDGNPELEALQTDIDEMSRMLEAYLSFARGEGVGQAAATDISALLEQLRADSQRQGHETRITFQGDPIVVVRPDAFKRCLTNLVSNAQRFC